MFEGIPRYTSTDLIEIGKYVEVIRLFRSTANASANEIGSM